MPSQSDLEKFGLQVFRHVTPAGKQQINNAIYDRPESVRYQLGQKGGYGLGGGVSELIGFDPNQYKDLNIIDIEPGVDVTQMAGKYGNYNWNTSRANEDLNAIYNRYDQNYQSQLASDKAAKLISDRNNFVAQNRNASYIEVPKELDPSGAVMYNGRYMTKSSYDALLNDPNSGGAARAAQIASLNQAMQGMTNEQIYAQGAALYPELAKQNPYNNTTPTFQTATGYTVPNVIPQAKVEGQYLYASDVLDKKANNAAVNALYNAYFNRNATAAELKNWGWDEKTQTGGGKDTTVRALEDFLKQERIKYGVKEPIGELGKIKPVKIDPTKGTTETIGSGKTGSDVSEAIEDNIASAPKAGEKTTIGKLKTFLADQEALAKQVQGFMKPSKEETALKNSYIGNRADIQNQPIQMAFIRGQQAVQDQKYQAQLALLQGDRQAELDAAKFLYDANRNNLSDTISLYKATAPENIGTHIDEATGTMYVVTKNPLTGEVATMNAGNVGAGKKYTSTSIQTDPVTNQMLFVGVKPDGSIETKALTQGGEKPLSSADRLKYAQDIVTNSGYTVTMEDALKQIDQAQGAVSAGTSGNRPDRNNNPLNIKVPAAGLEEAVRRYGDSGVSIDPVPATDGGYFLKFSSPESGMKAAETLLSSGVYSGLSVDVAMRKWSGGGYGAEVSPSTPATATVKSLSPAQRQQLVADMAKREGFTGSIGAGAPASTPSGQTFDQYLQMKQEEAGQSFAPQKVEQLRKEFEGAATKATEIVTGLRTAASNLTYSLPTEAAKKQLMGEVNKLIAKGDYKGAENKLKTVAVSTMKGDEKSEYNISKTVSVGMNDVQQKINQLKTDGATAGVYKNALESAKPYANVSKDQRWVSLVSDIQATQAKYRNQLFGASLTDNELAMSNSFLIDPTQDSLSTMITKANGLKTLADSVSKRLVNQKLGIEEEERPALDSFVVSDTQSSINPKFIR